MTQLCLPTYHFPSFTHTHNGDDIFPRFKSHYNLTSITGTLHEDRCTFMIISRSLPEMRSVLEKLIDTTKHIACSVTLLSRKSECLWDNVEKF